MSISFQIERATPIKRMGLARNESLLGSCRSGYLETVALVQGGAK
jgi:hypothetical protein